MARLWVALPLAAGLWAAEFSGYISDAACGWNNARNDPHAMDCARMCVREGWPPVLVPDGQFDAIKIANKEKAVLFVGTYVKITGRIEGATLTVTSIRSATPPPAPAKPKK